MAKPISLSFIANTKPLIRETENIEEALESVSDSLDDMARDGEKETEKLERSFKELAKNVERSSEQGSKSMKREFADGTASAKRDLEELGNEAKQNAAETFASFDGSAESFVDGIQGTLGGIVSSLGPMGAAAGAAGALGIGLVSAAFTEAQAEAERLAEVTSEAFTQMLESQTNYLTEEAILDNLQALYADTERWKQVQKDANSVGLETSLVARAMAGDSSALAEANAILADQYASVRKEAADYYEQTGELNYALISQEQDIKAVQDKLNAQGGAYQEAADRVEDYRDAVRDTQSAVADSVSRSTQVSIDRMNALAEKYGQVPTTVTTKVTADTSAADSTINRYLNKSETKRVVLEFSDRFGRRIV